MLTLFAIPKPFHGHIDVIQRNAISSWTRLTPRPQIILFGDEAGTAEIAEEFELRHVPEIARNVYRTPLVGDLFRRVQEMTTEGALCYVNADIILMSDFMTAAQQVIRSGRRCLLAGRRWDTHIREQLSFAPGWEEELRRYVTQYGHLDPPGSIDFFLFPKNFWETVPDFAFGRFHWDNWLLYQTLAQRAALIDATPSVMIIHQSHGYTHTSLGERGVQTGEGTTTLLQGPEALRNLELAGGPLRVCTLKDATHELTTQGITRRRFGREQVQRRIERGQIGWNVYSRRALGALEEAALPTSYFGYPARVLLGLIRVSTPWRQRLGRRIVAWRDAGK